MKKGGFGQESMGSGNDKKPSGESQSGGFKSGTPQMKVKEESGKQSCKNQGYVK